MESQKLEGEITNSPHCSPGAIANSAIRKSTNARAAGFAALPAGKTAWSSMSPMSQSGRTRTNSPSASSRLAAPSVIETSPSPATAAASPTSLKVTMRRPLTSTVTILPSFLKDQDRPKREGATITERPAKSAGLFGVPVWERYKGDAKMARGKTAIFWRSRWSPATARTASLRPRLRSRSPDAGRSS
jgi:hypothetical protein